MIPAMAYDPGSSDLMFSRVLSELEDLTRKRDRIEALPSVSVTSTK
jgi:hypothetical protein